MNCNIVKQQVNTKVILTVVIPDFMDFQDMQQWTNYFFEDVQLLKGNKRKPKKNMPER